MRELRDISDDWLSTHYGGEKYFLVGWFNDEYVRNSTVMGVHAPDGKLIAFANLIQAKDKNTIICADLMRYRPKTENGIVEFLTVSMMKWAISKGYETYSLSATTTYGKGTEPDDPPVAKILDVVGVAINRHYGILGLYKFKEKFHPRWEPRYIAYMGTPTPLPALFTMLRLYSGPKSEWWHPLVSYLLYL